MAIPFQTLWQRLWQDPPPALACEFLADAVGVARWSPGAAAPEQLAVRPLPEGALRPSPVRENLVQSEEVAGAVASALQEVAGAGRQRREIALLLPDLSARVSRLEFERLPARPEEILSLVKFRLRKTVPFEVEDAAISFELEGGEALVAIALRAVVRQYEALFEDLGYHPGLVTLSTLAGLGLVESGSAPAPDGGAMLLRNGGGLLTIAVSSQGKLRMLRSTELAAEDAEAAAVAAKGASLDVAVAAKGASLDVAGAAKGASLDVAGAGLDEVFHDVYSSAVFFQDHYGARIERIFMAGLGPQAETLAVLLESELGVRSHTLVVPSASPEGARFLGIYGMLAARPAPRR